jgi:hypothetical protein
MNTTNQFSYYNSTTIGNAGFVTGSGTYGYIPMWNGTTSINNSMIYSNGTAIGISTATPIGNLNVIGSANITGDISAGGRYYIYDAQSPLRSYMGLYTAQSNLKFYSEYFPFNFVTGPYKTVLTITDTDVDYSTMKKSDQWFLIADSVAEKVGMRITNDEGGGISNTGLFLGVDANKNGIISMSATGYNLSILATQIDVVGNLNQTSGNAYINNIYGEMYNVTNVGFSLNTKGSGGPINVSNLILDNKNGITANGNTGMVIGHNGTYQINWKLTASTAGNITGSIFLNGVNQTDCSDFRSGLPGVLKSTMGNNCILNLNQNDLLNLEIFQLGTDSPDASTIIYVAKITAVRIGNKT